jgi:hypothetical protein
MKTLQDIINNFNNNPDFKTKKSVEFSRRKKKVYQFDHQGKLLGEFNSINDACKKTGLHKVDIIGAVKGKSKFCKGYFWSDSKDTLFDLNKQWSHGRGYLVYDTNGVLINKFQTQEEITKTYNLNSGSVCLVLKGKRPHTKGFVIKYEI